MRTVSKRIIMVDEINEFIQRETSLLSREEFNLLTVRSGEEALFRAQNDKPDLLILNFYMPDLNGYQVCRKLKDDSNTEHIPVLIIAATGEEDDNNPVYLSEAAGCNGCIEKPIQYVDIVPLVEECLGVPPRRHTRTEVSLPCTITDEDGRRDAAIGNLTPAGFFVVVEPAPWPGDIVKVDLTPDGAVSAVSFQAAVRWSRGDYETGPMGAGCEFLGAPAELVKWLEDRQ
jgi:CheY-like chemotaxis protein